MSLRNTYHIEELPENDAKRLYQMERLRSFFYYPRRADPSNVKSLLEMYEKIEEKIPYDIDNHMFPYTEIPNEEMNAVILYLFESLLGRHAFARYNLANFLSDVKACYLPPVYHNYHHALCHVQSMYWILKTNPAVFTENEKKVLMIASLCHDVGHPGCNEDFLWDIFKILWYNSPVLEHHHAQTCCGIMLIEDSNILHDLPNEEFDMALTEIHMCILATFIKNSNQTLALLSELTKKMLDFADKEYRDAVKCLLMVVCDLSAAWKPWKVHVSATWCLYKEFADQGDKQLKLGKENPMMTTEKMSEIPYQQVDFLEKVALPIFEAAAKLFPCVYDAIESTRENMRQWIVDMT